MHNTRCDTITKLCKIKFLKITHNLLKLNINIKELKQRIVYCVSIVQTIWKALQL